jgi:hypothetical protein
MLINPLATSDRPWKRKVVKEIEQLKEDVLQLQKDSREPQLHTPR